MCRQCLVEAPPQRQTTTHDGGFYYANFRCCAQCATTSQQPPRETNRRETTEEENDEYIETVVFEHVCVGCNHVIAAHEYSLTIHGDIQEHAMVCALCGKGEYTQHMSVNRNPQAQERPQPTPAVVNLAQALAHLPVVSAAPVSDAADEWA